MYMHTYIYIYIEKIYIYIYMCMHIELYIYIYICMYVCATPSKIYVVLLFAVLLRLTQSTNDLCCVNLCCAFTA